MFTRDQAIKSIIDMLALFSTRLALRNRVGFYDDNTGAEYFFIKILNLTYDLSLTNLNIEKSNFPAIDLGDKNSRVSFQVTSETNTTKLKTTISKFKKYGLLESYDSLVFLILSNDKTGKATDNDIKINIINLKELSKDISKISDEKIYEIKRYLEEGLSHLDMFQNNNILPPTKKVDPARIDATNLITHYQITDYENNKNNFVEDLKSIQLILSKLNDAQRQVLYFVIVQGDFDKDESCIVMSSQELDVINDHYRIVLSLVNKNLMHIEHDYAPDGCDLTTTVVMPYFKGLYDYNMFCTLKDYYGADEAKLRKIIIGCDFSNL